MTRSRNTLLILMFSIALVCLGASESVSGSARIHPEFGQRFRSTGVAALLPPDVKVFELSAGGVSELRDDWCEAGRKTVIDALKTSCRAKGIDVRDAAVGKDIEEELEEIQALYEAISVSIGLHVYGQFVFPDKVRNFDYSLGPIDTILQRLGADYLMFVFALDEVTTAGRKALSVAASVIGAMAGVYIVPQGGLTMVSVALVDASGAILWFNVKGGRGNYDLRDCDSAASIVSAVLGELPGGAAAK